MHFSSDHNHHHTHHRRDEGEEDRDFLPPPPQVVHVSHVSHHSPLGPPPDHHFNNFPPPPPPHFYPRDEGEEFLNDAPPPPPMHQPESTTVQHISHQAEHGDSRPESHHFSPHIPSFLHPHDHKSNSSLVNQATCRVFCKARTGLSLSIVDAKVVFAVANTSDPLQHWYKDEKYSTQVKDQVGFPSFSLVNKATGQAIKHSLGAGYPVQLTAYDSNKLDESVLWTQGNDLGGGFRAIRMINNIHLNFTPLNADTRHGGIHDGTVLGLGEWKKSNNDHLQWNISPYCELKVFNICFLQLILKHVFVNTSSALHLRKCHRSSHGIYAKGIQYVTTDLRV